MSKLEQIFQLEDPKTREIELVKYAKLLKINTLKAKKADGSYSENELAVLIYNAEQFAKRSKFQTIALIVVAIFVMIVVFAGLNMFKMMLPRE